MIYDIEKNHYYQIIYNIDKINNNKLNEKDNKKSSHNNGKDNNIDSIDKLIKN